MRRSASPFIGVCIIVLTLGLLASSRALAHETDQHTLPRDREFVDLGDHITGIAYGAIDRGVIKVNERIDIWTKAGDANSVKQLQTPDEIAGAINREFPIALLLIEGLDKQGLSNKSRQQHPGELAAFKGGQLRKYGEISWYPFKAWPCSTIKVHGVYLGTDKIGHFTDMGMYYYGKYRGQLAAGKSEQEAMQAALKLGTDDWITSESGVLGYRTAAAYSNADLVANYMGMMFYMNITEPVMLKGELRPPMVVRDGKYWKVAPHVTRDSDFLSYFISDHWNEALNPSRYRPYMRPGIRRAMQEYRVLTLECYKDRHGERRSPQWFIEKGAELSTYWGAEYGHEGHDLLNIGVVSYGPPTDGTDVAARDAVGTTLLHRVAMTGDVAKAIDLLDRGADVNAQVRSNESQSADWGSTPLHFAARDGQLELAQLLIARGANVNAKSDRGVTPLHKAVEHADVAALLIEKGGKLEIADGRGRTPLHWAAIEPDTAVLKLFLAKGANPNLGDQQGRTPLYLAALDGNVDATKVLLASGAKPNLSDEMRSTPLHAAAASKNAEIATLLLDAGAPVAVKDDFGYTPLHDATRSGSNAVVAALLQHGADVDVADAYGTTPLHIAGRMRNESIARVLVDAGADTSARNASSVTPAQEAARAGDERLAAMLNGSSAGAASSSSSSTNGHANPKGH